MDVGTLRLSLTTMSILLPHTEFPLRRINIRKQRTQFHDKGARIQSVDQHLVYVNAIG